MTIVTIQAAKTTLSQLIARVHAGEEMVIARGKEPVARLAPFHAPKPKRQFGALRGIVSVDASFFDPLPEEELRHWE